MWNFFSSQKSLCWIVFTADLNFMFYYERGDRERVEVKVLKIMQLLPFASIYLLKAQIGTEIYWFPLLVTGIFPAQSTCTRQNIFVVTGIGITVVEIQGSIQHIILWARTIHSLVFIWTDFFQNTVFACLQIGLFFTFSSTGIFQKIFVPENPGTGKKWKTCFFSVSTIYCMFLLVEGVLMAEKNTFFPSPLWLFMHYIT